MKYKCPVCNKEMKEISCSGLKELPKVLNDLFGFPKDAEFFCFHCNKYFKRKK